jgi:hypothetical protein
MRAQAAEQQPKLASLNRQIEQKRAEADSIMATIAKLDATMPLGLTAMRADMLNERYRLSGN